VSVVAPCVLSVLTGHQARRQQAEDWARQDEVADRLTAAQHAAADKAAEAAELLLESNERVAEAATTQTLLAEGVDRKLDAIHGLVNSTLTAAKESEMAAKESELAALVRLVDFVAGGSDAGAIDRLDTQIAGLHTELAELRTELDDRAKATVVADDDLNG
jgi:hypothetical protein